MNCKNCGLPIEKMIDPWGYDSYNGKPYGWHHHTIEREANIDGADVHIYATFCPDDLGEAEPADASVLQVAATIVCGLALLGAINLIGFMLAGGLLR